MDDKNLMLVKNIIAHVSKVLVYCGGMDEKSFVTDNKTVDACLINLQQIGELANKTGEQFKATHPDIPWNEMRGLRNIIAHNYDGVNVFHIWNTINSSLPDLLRQLDDIIKNMQSSP